MEEAKNQPTQKKVASVDMVDVSGTADEMWRVFASTMEADKPHTVARFGRLCRFGRDDESGALELHVHDLDTLRDQLTKHVRFIQYREKDGEVVPVDVRPPNEAILAILKRPLDRLDEIAPVPRVDRVINVPVFAPDGTLVTEAGYHDGARVYYDGVPMQDIATHWNDPGTRVVDVEDARRFILEELLGEFPFADHASRAHALAMVVEQFARGVIIGPAPAYVVIASEQGTGKSLLAQACLTAACGRISLQPEPDPNPSDFQKRLLSELIRGPQAIVFDNVTRKLENSALSTMLTTGRYADRVLGKSQILSFPIRHTTVFTMNNPEIGPDMRRRLVPIYLDAGCERPWDRVGPSGRKQWRHPDLLVWATANRQRLVEASLTLVANYIMGWSEVDHHTGEEVTARVHPPRLMGTFEQWSTVIGGIVTAAGVEGFGANLDHLYEEQSEDDSEEARFLAEWPQDTKLTAQQVLRLVTVGLSEDVIISAIDPPPALRDSRTEKLTAQSVGNGLRRMRGRVRGGRRLVNRRGRETLWFVETT